MSDKKPTDFSGIREETITTCHEDEYYTNHMMGVSYAIDHIFMLIREMLENRIANVTKKIRVVKSNPKRDAEDVTLVLSYFGELKTCEELLRSLK